MSRITRAADALRAAGHDALFVTPGADLTWLTGYRALPLERLTCLAIRSDGRAWLIVPALERPAAQAHDVESHGIHLIDWQETQDPYVMLAAATGTVSSPVVSNLMTVEKAYRLQDAFEIRPALVGAVLSDLRAVKDAAEIAALHEAGAAIDAVHAQVPQWLRAGRTEREVGRDIADAIIAAGHATVDFVIVASGPNGASPHHEVSDRVIQQGDPVVVDIGGTMPSGYCSDSTRTYSVGDPGDEYRGYFDALVRAQSAATEHAGPGVTCESVDAAARDVLESAGLGQYFIHRTGHGIGLETHEEPYIVSGNSTALVPGHAFSIEPGFYIPGRFGARIEDIVTCASDGVRSANHSPRDLVIV